MSLPTIIPNVINKTEHLNGNSIPVFDVFSPETELTQIPNSDLHDIENAANSAYFALKKWRVLPPPRRAEILLEIAKEIESEKKNLSEIICREIGKIPLEAEGEVQEVIDSAIFFAGEGRRSYGYTTPSELSNKICLTFRDPIGVVALVTPWNFPMAVPSWKLFAALISGNSIIFKPSEFAPYSGYSLVNILNRHLPEGLVNVVHGKGKDIVSSIIEHSKVRMVSFTGSTKIGRSVMQLCGQYGKRVSVELGGNNAQIVLDDADLEMACEGAVWGAFATSGQRCTSTSRLIIQKELYSQFVDLFAEKTVKFTKNIMKDKTRNTPLRKKEQLDVIKNAVDYTLKDKKVELLCGNRPINYNDNSGLYYHPTILLNVTKDCRIFNNEVFGPVVSIIKVDDLDDAISVANDVDQGLSTSIYTNSVINSMKAMQCLDSGIVYINAPTIGAEVHLPFGGTKSTGNGFRDSGKEALDAFTEHKTVYIDYSSRLQRAQIDNRK